jgi:hypothetical protein
MNFPRGLLCAIIPVAFLLPSTTASAQDKFPSRTGEWTLTAPDPTDASQPFVMNLCMNDQTWAKTLSGNPTCTISKLTRTTSGLTYSIACNAKTVQINGTGTWTFDGAEHIISKSVFTITANGKTNTTSSAADYRWKAATCNPNDANLHDHPAH